MKVTASVIMMVSSLLLTPSDAFAPLATSSITRQMETTTATTSTSLYAQQHEKEENTPAVSRKTALSQIFTTAAATVVASSVGVSTSASAADTSLDFSLPSYDTKMQGFGDGKEAILNSKGRADRTDPGANEREKQSDAMRKAEEARLEAKAKKKAEMKAAEEEAKRRAAERKARDAERLKNIWN